MCVFKVFCNCMQLQLSLPKVVAYRALDLEERESDRRLPVLRRLEDEVVERVADLRILSGIRVFAKQTPGVSAIVVHVWAIP